MTTRGHRIAALIAVLVTALIVAPTFAQELGDIPRPEELEATGDEDSPLRIEQPRDGADVETPFTVSGTAPAGARLELWLDDDLERVFQADSLGRFTTPVNRPVSPDTKIWIHNVSKAGDRLGSQSVVVNWSGEGDPIDASQTSRTPPPVTAPKELETESTPDEGVERSSDIPVTEDVDLDTLTAPPPPPPVDEAAGLDPFEGTAAEDSAAGQTPAGEVTEYQAQRPQTNRSVRALAEFGIGLGSAFVGALAGGTIGLGLGLGTGDPFAASIIAVLGGFGGWLIGLPIGVTIGGNMLDGNGAWWAAVLGEVAGFLAFVLVANTVFNPGVVLFSFLALPTAGAVVGYELSSDPSARAAEAQQTGVQSMRPVIIPSDNGTAFGFGLRF